MTVDATLMLGLDPYDLDQPLKPIRWVRCATLVPSHHTVCGADACVMSRSLSSARSGSKLHTTALLSLALFRWPAGTRMRHWGMRPSSLAPACCLMESCGMSPSEVRCPPAGACTHAFLQWQPTPAVAADARAAAPAGPSPHAPHVRPAVPALPAQLPDCSLLLPPSLLPASPPRLTPACLSACFSPAAGFTFVDDRLNCQLYGEDVTAAEILGGRVALPAEFLPLYQTIDLLAAEAQARGRCQSPRWCSCCSCRCCCCFEVVSWGPGRFCQPPLCSSRWLVARQGRVRCAVRISAAQKRASDWFSPLAICCAGGSPHC
jgi:hypothetical protein